MVKFPKNTRQIINQIREQIGRVVLFYYRDGFTECTYSGCNLDPTTGLSTLSFCPVCSGKHYIPVIRSSGILAHITWKSMDDEYLVPAGVDVEGRVRIQIEHTPNHEYIVENMLYAIVDGKRIERKTHDYRGVPEINRIVIIGRQLDD